MNTAADMLIAAAKTLALCRGECGRRPKNFHAQEMLAAAEHGYSVARNLHDTETTCVMESIKKQIDRFGKSMHDELLESTRQPSAKGKAMRCRIAARHQRDLVVAVMTLTVMQEVR